jgi:hypothetical protein
MREIPILFSAPMVRALLAGTKTQTRRAIRDQSIGERFSHMTDAGLAHLEWLGTPCCGSGVWDVPEHSAEVASPYGQPGGQLWVRETYYAWGRWETRFSAKKGRDEWHFVDLTLDVGKAYLHTADGQQPQPMGGKRHRGGVTPTWWKRPAIFMPRAASRITLEVTGVRVERLQDISEKDAIAEGCHGPEDDIASNLPNCPNCGGIGLYTAFNPSTGGALPDTDCRMCDTSVKRYRLLWESINGPDSWSANPWVWCVEFRRLP